MQRPVWTRDVPQVPSGQKKRDDDPEGPLLDRTTETRDGLFKRWLCGMSCSGVVLGVSALVFCTVLSVLFARHKHQEVDGFVEIQRTGEGAIAQLQQQLAELKAQQQQQQQQYGSNANGPADPSTEAKIQQLAQQVAALQQARPPLSSFDTPIVASAGKNKNVASSGDSCDAAKYPDLCALLEADQVLIDYAAANPATPLTADEQRALLKEIGLSEQLLDTIVVRDLEAPNNQRGRNLVEMHTAVGKAEHDHGEHTHGDAHAFIAMQNSLDYMRQVAVRLGLLPDDAQSKRTDTPADYPIDYDNDGVDDIAVVHLEPKHVIPSLSANNFNIPAGTEVVYTRTAPNTYTISVNSNVPLLSTSGATQLLLGDDDASAELTLGHSFIFAGAARTSCYVGSDGYVSFGASESSSYDRDLTRFIDSVPRIAALFTDTDPTCSGTVHFDTNAVRTVVTYTDITHYMRYEATGVCPGAETITTQIILYADHSFALRFGNVDSAFVGTDRVNTHGVTGATVGHGGSPVTAIQIVGIQAPLSGITVGTAAEQWTGTTPVTLNYLGGIQKFYQTWPDHFDTIMVTGSGWETDREQDVVFCCYWSFVVESTGGLGSPAYNFSSFYGSSGELDGYISEGQLHMRSTGSREAGTYAPGYRKFRNTRPLYRGGQLYDGSGSTLLDPVFNTFFPFFELPTNGAKDPYTHEGRTWFTGPQGSARSTEYSVYTQEQGHRWTMFQGFRHPNATLRASSFKDIIGRGQAHWSQFVDTRLRPSQHTDAGQFTQYRPRADTSDGSHITRLVRDSVNPLLFRDANNPSITYPETSDYRLNRARNRCNALGKEMFIRTPGYFVEGFHAASQVMAGVRTLESLSTEEREMFYVDDPRSIFEPTGQWHGPLDAFAGSRQVIMFQNLAFCGTQVNFTVDDLFDTADVAIAAGIPLQEDDLHIRYGPREPKIGDEGDQVDWTIINSRPALQQWAAQYNLAAQPIVNDATCNSPMGTPGRSEAVCVDVKTTALTIFVEPGKKLSAAHRLTAARIHRDMARLSNTDFMDGRGARGRCVQTGNEPSTGFPVYGSCTADYIPKFFWGLQTPIH